ncbi:hypothetical protein FO519_000876 [Halicephalobus sp. NKZ332]|nr:hypothetical protein FO519_000876 [Halicephalobus sp. NKZ332]
MALGNLFSDDENNRGVCGLRTEIAADIVAGLQCSLALVLTVDVDGITILSSVIEIIADLFVFYAHYKQSAVYYIPYFVVTGIVLSIGIFFELILIGCVVTMPQWWIDSLVRGDQRMEKELIPTLRLLTTISAGGLLIILFIVGWFYKIVIDAFKSMRQRSIR